MVTHLESHTDGDYDLPPRTGVLKKYKSSNTLGANVKRLQEHTRRLEVEAYKAVLRAFVAQSDGLSWAKFGLMSELRKELRVTDDQHKELMEAADDASVRKIREARTLNSQQIDPPPPTPAPARKRKAPETPKEEPAPAPAPAPVQRTTGATPVKKFFQRQKKVKNTAPLQPDLTTLDALRSEVERLESEPDMNRLVHAKTAAHEMKRKILDALEQCGADDEDDSEKTADEARDENHGGEEGDDSDDEKDDERDVKTEVDIEI